MLKRLIENQKIRIDAHQRGNGHIDNWDDPSTDIHIHKTTRAKISGKSVNVEIRIPLNSNREATFEIGKAENEIARKRLSREIRDALTDVNTRQGFIDDLIDTLDNYPTTLSSIDRCTNAVRRLAQHFGLIEQVEEDIIAYAGQRIISFTSTFQDEDDRRYAVSLDEDNIEISEIDNYSRKVVRLNER
jgi:hypothetical protein